MMYYTSDPRLVLFLSSTEKLFLREEKRQQCIELGAKKKTILIVRPRFHHFVSLHGNVQTKLLGPSFLICKRARIPVSLSSGYCENIDKPS